MFVLHKVNGWVKSSNKVPALEHSTSLKYSEIDSFKQPSLESKMAVGHGGVARSGQPKDFNSFSV